MIKLAANAALMTRISFINEIANVCEATGADVVQGRRGDRARPPDRPELPPGRHRLRRQLLPEGLARAEAARRELGLPLPAAQRGDRGERAAEAPRGRQAARSARQRCAARPSRCSGSRSSRTPTTCARRRRSCSPAGCSPRAPTSGSGIPIAQRRRPPRRRAGRHGRRGGSPAPTRWCSSPSGRSWPRSTGRRSRATMRTRVFIDGRNFLDPAAMRAAGLRVRGRSAGPPTTAVLMEAIVLAGGKAERLGDAAGGRPKSLVPVGGQAAARLADRPARARRASTA